MIIRIEMVVCARNGDTGRCHQPANLRRKMQNMPDDYF